MIQYSVYTQCGVITRYYANNSYLAAQSAREDGWKVVQVLVVK